MVSVISIKINYIVWHYGRGTSDVITIWKNLLWFIYNFFSIPQLVGNLFSPWRAISDRRTHKDINISEIASVFIINTIMRIVGFLIRSIFLIVGVVAGVMLFVIGILAFLSWLILPFLLLALVVTGVVLLTGYI